MSPSADKDLRVWLDRRPPPYYGDEYEPPPYQRYPNSQEEDREHKIQSARQAAWKDLLESGINEHALMAIKERFFGTNIRQIFGHGHTIEVEVRQNLLYCIDLAHNDFSVPFTDEEWRRAVNAVCKNEPGKIWGKMPAMRYDWKGIPRSLIEYPGASLADAVIIVDAIYKLAWILMERTLPLQANTHRRADSLEIMMIYCHYDAAKTIEEFFYRSPEDVRKTLGVSCLVCPIYIDTQRNWHRNTGISEKAWYAAAKEFKKLIAEGAPTNASYWHFVGHSDRARPPLTYEEKKLLKKLK